MYLVILKTRVTLVGSISLSYNKTLWVDVLLVAVVLASQLTETFFCVTNTTLSLPLTAILVTPEVLTALNAYSAGGVHRHHLMIPKRMDSSM